MSGAARSRRAVLFRCRDAVSAGDSGAMEPFPFLAGTAGALVGVCKTLVPACWRRSLRCCRKPSGQPGVVDDLNGIVDRAVLAPLATRMSHQGQPV